LYCRASPSIGRFFVTQFQLADAALGQLARNHRFVERILRLVWPALLDARAVVGVAPGADLDRISLDEWNRHYREHLGLWVDANAGQLEALLESLGVELVRLLEDLEESGEGRPHVG